MVKSFVTIILIILCIATSLFAWIGNTELIFNIYGYSTENLLSGNIWVLIISIFLHANMEHLVSNMVVLFLFGLTLEPEIGTKKYLLIFFLGALLGDLLSSLIYSTNQISIGASAGIFSIIAATMLIKPIKIEVFMPIPLGIIAVGYLMYAVYGLITGYPPYVSHIAHIGGSIIGLTYGFHQKGFRNALRIMIAMFILLLFVPIIWNFWVLIVNSVISLF